MKKKILSFITLLCMVVTLLSTNIIVYAATSGICGNNLTWVLNGSTLTISGSGEMYNYSKYASSSSWRYNASSIKSVNIQNGVTSIGNYAFYNCTNIGSITIPESVTEIGDYAFYGCTGLKNISIPKSITSIGLDSFQGCTGLESIIIPDGVTKLDAGAFYGCTSLTSLTIPNSVTEIGNYAFCDCTSLTNVDLSKNITKLNYGIFKGCTSLENIDISNNVTEICGYAFYNCTNLTNINIPNTVTQIGHDAFYNCTSLTSINIPDNITKISNYTFYGCTSLTSVTIPDNVTELGYCAFYDCTSLASINIPENITNIGGSVLYNTALYNDDNNWEDDVLYIGNALIAAKATLTDEYDLKENTVVIAENAFRNCDKLTKITINDGISTIGDDVFWACKALTEIIIPDTVTQIGNDAFYNCTSLKSITIPMNISSIGNDAFRYCSNLKKINWNAKNVPDFTTNSVIFENAGIKGDVITVEFGNCVEHIPAYLFYGNNSSYEKPPKVTSVTIGTGVTSIGNNAFSSCTDLTNISVDDSNVNYCSIDGNLFNKEKTTLLQYSFGKKDTYYEIPSTVTNISTYAFNGCTALTEINIPSSVVKIGVNAFYNCTNINKVNISDVDAWCEIDFESIYSNPLVYAGKLYYNQELLQHLKLSENVKSIKQYAFYNCGTLITAALPESITSIEYSAFYGCYALQSIEIPKNVNSLSGRAFTFCKNLKAINVSKNNDNYCSENGVLYSKSKIELLTFPAGSPITKFTIPEGTKISTATFAGCENLLELNVGKLDYVNTSLKFRDFFGDCINLKKFEYYGTDDYFLSGIQALTKLETVIIPNVDFYGATYFKGLESLKTIDISSAYAITDYAFQNCTNLEKVICAPRKIGKYAFSYCDKLKCFFVAPESGGADIGERAFYGCNSLETISFPNRSKIGVYAFSGCYKLKKVYLNDYSAYMQNDSINNNAFYGVTATVYYPSGSNKYDSNSTGNFGGTLTWEGVDYGVCGIDAYWQYDNETSTLTVTGKGNVSGAYFSGSYTPWSYLNDKLDKIIIKDGITTIPSYAFEYAKAKEIILPNTLTKLALNAFNDCTNLNNLIIPSSIESFISSHFNRCSRLTDIYYVGTKEEFEKIPCYKNLSYYGAKVHCLVWNKSTVTCTDSGYEGYYTFDDMSIYDYKYDTNKNRICTELPRNGKKRTLGM